MIRKNINSRTTLIVNESYEGEFLETKLARMVETKEPIKADSPNIYTPRKDGVYAETDIRTDRWDIAQELADQANKKDIAKRTPVPGKPEGETTQATTPEE